MNKSETSATTVKAKPIEDIPHNLAEITNRPDPPPSPLQEENLIEIAPGAFLILLQLTMPPGNINEQLESEEQAGNWTEAILELAGGKAGIARDKEGSIGTEPGITITMESNPVQDSSKAGAGMSSHKRPREEKGEEKLGRAEKRKEKEHRKGKALTMASGRQGKKRKQNINEKGKRTKCEADENTADAPDGQSAINIKTVFPAGLMMVRNKHPTLTDQQLIAHMRHAREKRMKTQLKEISSDVWDQKGNLRKNYEYLMQLPESRDPADSMTANEKQAYINNTPKALQAREFPTLFNAKGDLHQWRPKEFMQPRKPGTTLFESPVYNPAEVLPMPANYAKHLAMATAETPTAANLGVARLSKSRKEIANEKHDVIAKEARLKQTEEEVRQEHASLPTRLAQKERRIKELEIENEKLKEELRALRGQGLKSNDANNDAEDPDQQQPASQPAQ